jgi:hypothetical protein
MSGPAPPAGAFVPIPVTVSDLSRDGIRLVSPFDADFDRIAKPLIGRRADQLLGLKPLLVLITNDTAKTVAAASVIFRIKKLVGQAVTWTNVAFPDIVIGDIGSERRLGIRPAESTVVAQGIVVEDFDGPGPEDWYREMVTQFIAVRDEDLKDAVSLSIELDAVIFDDATLIGPDNEGKLATLFKGRLSAYQGWLRTIADGLAAGLSVEAAYWPLLRFQDEVKARRGSLGGLRGESRQDYVEKTNAAAVVVGWRRRVGDIEVAKRISGLRLSQFDVHR